MITTIKFILFTVFIILSGNTYFEYCINRECPITLAQIVGLAYIVLIILYGLYSVRLLIKLLKLKK